MKLLKSNWRWCTFNLAAILISVYVLTQGTTGWTNLVTFDSGLESGKWAIRFLLISLTMTPLSTYLGWNSAIKLRKSAGLWAFGFASLHVLFYIQEARLHWLMFPMPNFLILGLAGMLILNALAVTSNRRSMKRLGKNWKRLHRLVYLAGMTVVTHSMLATLMSKKLMSRDPEAIHELKIYAVVLCALLIVRIPLVRKLLKKILYVSGTRRKVDMQIYTLPGIDGRESGALSKPTLMIPSAEQSLPEYDHMRGQIQKTRELSISPEEDSELEGEQELQSV